MMGLLVVFKSEPVANVKLFKKVALGVPKETLVMVPTPLAGGLTV